MASLTPLSWSKAATLITDWSWQRKQKRDAFTILPIYTQLKAALQPMCVLSNDLQEYTFKLNTVGDLMAVRPTFPHILSLFKYLHSPQQNPL